MSKIIEEGISGFDWENYQDQDYKNRTLNQKVVEKYPEAKVYSDADNTLELYEMMQEYPIINKDLDSGDIVLAEDMKFVRDSSILVELSSGIYLEIDLKREKTFCEYYGIDSNKVKEIFTNRENVEYLLGHEIFVYIRNRRGNLYGDLSRGHIEKMKVEFFENLDKPDSAYKAKILERNKGGFFVEVAGVPAFLPGGLAAANKITNYDKYLGKEVNVMIDSYFVSNDTFVVSHKKYIDYVLPSAIKALDKETLYKGKVTGTTKYGVFIEFSNGIDDILLTGLLHTSKMNETTRSLFKERRFKPGNEIEFWIKEITKGNKIILTDIDPMEKVRKVQDFAEINMGMVKAGKIVSIKHFGALVKMDDDIIGLIPRRELHQYSNNYNVNDSVIVNVSSAEKDKIYLKLVNES